MPRRVLVALFVLGIFPLTVAAQRASLARAPIAYVSLQRVASQSAVGKDAARRLETLRDERSRAIADKQKRVDALRLQVAQNGGMFRGSTRAQLQKDEERERIELQKMKEQAQADVQKLQQEVQTTLHRELTGALNDVAAAHGSDLIVNADTSVLWSKPGLDLTAEVLDRLNARAPTK